MVKVKPHRGGDRGGKPLGNFRLGPGLPLERCRIKGLLVNGPVLAQARDPAFSLQKRTGGGRAGLCVGFYDFCTNRYKSPLLSINSS